MKVLLADDHTLFREGVRLVLESLVEEALDVIEACDFVEALAALRSNDDIDVALVDLSMPGSEGFAGIEAMRRAMPDLALVVVSASEDPRDVRRALSLGVHGYITKNSSSNAMVQGIRAVLSGERFLSSGLDPGTAGEGEAREPGAEDLTPRQREVLGMLRQGKSNKEIARELQLAEITVKLHVTAILRTLGCDNRTQAAILAAKMGW